MSDNAEKTTLQQLTLFAGDSPVRTCPLPESGRAWLESDQDFGMSSIELLQNLGRDGWLLRMSLAFYPAMGAEILPLSFAGWSNAGMACAGGFLTLNISEWPKDAAVCSLSEALEAGVAPKFFLSPKAARGILRRAEKRGRALPAQLEAVLRSVATRQGEGEKTITT